MAITEKDIIICGHGSGTPRTIRMDTYLTSRYNQKMSNGHRKGLIRVRRLKALTDDGRKKFHDKYATILGRNIYNQSLRGYCYKKYRDGRYYSDCSSSQCLTFDAIGYDCPDYNTEGILTSYRYVDVPVNIRNGHITNPEILRVGDQLLFAGNASHKDYVGHVEGVYSISGDSPGPDYSDKVKAFQEFLNVNYKNVLREAGTGQLVVDGDYGPITRNAALGVWKYMANKYYGANLTISNHNFFSSCKAVAAKMTDAEIAKHYTLQEIKNGVLAGKGFDSVKAFQKAKDLVADGSMNADTWHAMFN